MSGSSRSVAKLALVVAAFYAALWLATATFGTSSVRSSVVGPKPPHAGMVDLSAEDHPELRPNSFFYKTSAVAPFLVRMQYGHACGPECGQGGVDLYLWFPGGQHLIHREHWIS
jgi:hypothetical protein